MKMYVLAIRDRQQDGFSQPAFVPAIGLAVRGFGDEINNEQSPMFNHADDYDLYQLATWDTDTGEFTNLDRPKQIAIGKELKTQPARG